RDQIIEKAKESGIVVYEPRPPAKPTLEEALAIVTEHYHVHAKARGKFEGSFRGRDFSFAPDASDPLAQAMQPPDLRRIIEELKRMACPYILVAIHRDLYSGASHGWCNGSNWGADIIKELMRCAELNFRQELAKCGAGGERRGMRELPASE